MKAILFSGQGSQYVGMGADVAGAFPGVRELALHANGILGYDLLKIMSSGPADLLTQTKITQPALFLHEAMVLEVTNIQQTVQAVAGHSLGEFSALYAAGVLSFADGLNLVKIRGELMFASGESTPGTMAAVIGLDDDVVANICQEFGRQDNHIVVPANYNSPGQVVISGSRELLRSILPVFKEKGARMVKELQVSGAFHSPLLLNVQDEWTSAVNATQFNDPHVPVYVNVSAKATTDRQELRRAIIEQMTSPVLWTQTMQNMFKTGITHFVEVGPQTVLQGLAKRTLTDVITEGIDKVSDCERYIASRENHE